MNHSKKSQNDNALRKENERKQGMTRTEIVLLVTVGDRCLMQSLMKKWKHFMSTPSSEMRE